MTIWRSGFGGWLLVAGSLATAGLGACQPADGGPDPVSKPSEVAGRVWFCTPERSGQPAYVKSSSSAVALEIVSGADPPDEAGGRFPPGTVLGQAVAHAGDVWSPGSVHAFPVTWIQAGVRRSDLERPSVRARVIRTVTGLTPDGAPGRWVFSFFLSLDVHGEDPRGNPTVDWHLAVVSADALVAEDGAATVVDAPFSAYRGWPHPCPRA